MNLYLFLSQSNIGVMYCPARTWSFKAWLFVMVGLSCNNNFSKCRLCLWVDKGSCVCKALSSSSLHICHDVKPISIVKTSSFPSSLLHFSTYISSSHSLGNVKLKISKRRREKYHYFSTHVQSLLIFCYFYPWNFHRHGFSYNQVFSIFMYIKCFI